MKKSKKHTTRNIPLLAEGVPAGRGSLFTITITNPRYRNVFLQYKTNLRQFE